ncbi:MAG: thioredoxin [Treponema sp.]|nr:thioredoxin [Treponema sp.]
MVKSVINNDLGEAKKAAVAVLDFNATWCGPCRMLAPVLEEVSEEMKTKAEFFSVDVDVNPELAAEYGIIGVPCVVILKNGESIGIATGFRPKEDLIEFINSKI